MKKVETYKLIKARSGVNSAIIKQEDEKPYHLHSTVDPVKEANEWLSHIQLEECTVYIVFGCGLGYHVRALWDNIPENSILVTFLSEAEFSLGVQGGTKGPLYNLENKRIFLARILDLYNVAVLIAQRMLEFDIKKIKICKYYPAMRMNADFYALCEKNLVKLLGETIALNVNVNLFTGIKYVENYWRNIPYIATNPGIANFENVFRGWPCIVVSGGPSLNKNINILKECLPYAVVIASGSTMGALHKHGITPHFLVATDANLEMFDALDGCCDEHTVLLASIEVYHKVVSRYPGRLCFAYTDEDNRNIFADYLPKTARLRQTSSVATVAIDFAQYCGVEKMIMVGQDLAFVGNEYHAAGRQGGDGYEQLGVVEVLGYDGGMIHTIPAFKTVIDYLEVYAKNTPKIHFINATEGGAKLAGMEQLSLAEVKNTFLGRILPIEDKINEIFEEFGTATSKVDLLINELVQQQRHCYNVVQLLENYDKEHPDFKMISENQYRYDDINVLIVHTQNLGEFFEEIKKHAFAPSYKTFLTPRLQVVEFYRQDEEPLVHVYGVYVEMFKEFQELIKEMSQWINDALVFLENK